MGNPFPNGPTGVNSGVTRNENDDVLYYYRVNIGHQVQVQQFPIGLELAYNANQEVARWVRKFALILWSLQRPYARRQPVMAFSRMLRGGEMQKVIQQIEFETLWPGPPKENNKKYDPISLQRLYDFLFKTTFQFARPTGHSQFEWFDLDFDSATSPLPPFQGLQLESQETELFLRTIINHLKNSQQPTHRMKERKDVSCGSIELHAGSNNARLTFSPFNRRATFSYHYNTYFEITGFWEKVIRMSRDNDGMEQYLHQLPDCESNALAPPLCRDNHPLTIDT